MRKKPYISSFLYPGLFCKSSKNCTVEVELGAAAEQEEASAMEEDTKENDPGDKDRVESILVDKYHIKITLILVYFNLTLAAS